MIALVVGFETTADSEKVERKLSAFRPGTILTYSGGGGGLFRGSARAGIIAV